MIYLLRKVTEDLRKLMTYLNQNMRISEEIGVICEILESGYNLYNQLSLKSRS